MLLACLLPPHAVAQPRPPAATQQAVDEQLIVTVRSNGIARGEFTLIRTAAGDFLIPAADLAKLQIRPIEQARRSVAGETHYAVSALGATSVVFNEAELTLDIDFRADVLEGTRIDLSSRPAPVMLSPSTDSLVLSYRLTMQQQAQGRVEAGMDNDLGVRIGGLLLRQETRLDTSRDRRHFMRGATQLVWDDRKNATRLIAGDAVSSAGPYGSTITGGGLLFTKLYDLTPDVIRHPSATLQASTALPAQVEVAVDGSTIYRTEVGPGPISLNNLLLNGGTRNLRVTITDAAGRRQVIEQPFLFTDSVLAKGFHEYSYFVGKRSELDADNVWRYREPAWQALHRYGVSDSVTVAAGGEGNADFHNAGGGITLRSDRLGLLSVDLLSSTDRKASTQAYGWSTRYTYQSPLGSVLLGRRQFDANFRTFTTGILSPFPRSETRVGVATSWWRLNLSADLVRTVDDLEKRDTAFFRVSTNLSRTLSLFAEYQTTRIDGRPGWAANVYLRKELDGGQWVSSTVRAEPGIRGVELQAGKQVPQGEGFGYRIGVSPTWNAGTEAGSAFVAADWRLRPVSLGFFATGPLHGGGGSFIQAGVSGAVVALDDYWGLTRQVNDGFALAKLGVPQPGVEIYMNSQPQGRTDAQGRLFIPQVSSFGRQEVSLNDKDLPLEYTLHQKRHTIAPSFRSGTVVDFGIRKIRAVAGTAWQVRGGQRTPIASRAWGLAGAAGGLTIETGSAGDFYLEDAAPGTYTGHLQAQGRTYACSMTVPEFSEAVHELKEGVVCE